MTTRILSREEIRRIEHENASLEPPLMERAGQAAAGQALALIADKPGPVLVLAGPGNNGGDAFVLARVLRERGISVHLVCRAEPECLPEDARRACLAWLEAGGLVAQDFGNQGCEGRNWVLAVDGLFGIGLNRAVEGDYARWIERINELNCPVLALDIPSGLDAESGVLLSPTVKASHTASFIAFKSGLLTLDGPDHCGEIQVHDLGLELPQGEGELLSTAPFRHRLKPRRHNVHKGNFGSAAVIGGATGMAGAGLLAARAALHLGAGKVFLGLLDSPGFAVDPLFPEIMFRPPEELMALATALAVGPGLGQSEAAFSLLYRSLSFSGPLLLDADALNLLATSRALQDGLEKRVGSTVLTPHPAEAARLLGLSTGEVQSDRISAARALARRFRASVVLKGCGAIVALPDGSWYINTRGHGGMASAGMGDVLSGLILALLAQGWTEEEALLTAVYLHGLAAERLARRGVGPVGLCADETIQGARYVFNAWLSEGALLD